MPTSWLITSPSSAARACSPSVIFWRNSPRSFAGVAAHAGKARAAAWTALSTSSAVPAGIVAKTSSVAESKTSSVSVPVGATQAPSM